MKLAILASLIGAASAFAPASSSGMFLLMILSDFVEDNDLYEVF